MSLASRNDIDGNLQALYYTGSQETVKFLKPVWFYDDFYAVGAVPASGSAVDGYVWNTELVQTGGTPSVGEVANKAGGVMGCALDSTSEAQSAVLYWGDALNWNPAKSLQIEVVAAAHVLPTGVAYMNIGVASAYAAEASLAEFIQFEMLASGVVNIRVLDGTNSLISHSSGVTVVADAYHVFRIDASNIANIQFYIDGVNVNNGNVMAWAPASALVLQPYLSVQKASGTGVATLYVDSFRIAADR